MKGRASIGAFACAIGSSLAGGAVISACVSVEPWACARDDDCVAPGGNGRCEETRYCSYPDAECTSERRYSDLAGPYAGLCTELDPQAESSSGGADVSTASGDSSTSSGTDGSDGSTGCPPPCTPGGTERWSFVRPGAARGDDKLSAVVALGEGDLVAGGYVQAATRDAWLLRVSPDGEVITELAHDVDGESDSLNDVALAADGDLWVCGSRRLMGSERAWIASVPTSLDAVAADTTLAHFVCRTIGVARGDAVVAGGQDYGGSGPYAWAHVFPPWSLEAGTTTIEMGAQETDALRAAARIPGGGFLLGGARDLVGIVFALQDDGLGPIHVQTGPNGGVQGLAAGEDGYVVGGYQDSAGSQHDGWVSARDLDGSERWSFQPADPSPINDEIEGVAIGPAGEVLAVGFSGLGKPQRWVIKLDVEGTLMWSVLWPLHAPDDPLAQDIARDVVVLPDGDVVVVGEVTAADGRLDAWMARLAP